MTTYARLEINDTIFSDFNVGAVKKSIGEDNTSSTFSFTFRNDRGRYSSTFNVGDEIEVWEATQTVNLFDVNEAFDTTINKGLTTADWDTSLERLKMSSSSNHNTFYNTVSKSVVLDTTMGNIPSIVTTWAEIKWGNDVIQIFINLDNNDDHWEEIQNNIEYTFINPGNQPRFMVVFRGNGGSETYIDDLVITDNTNNKIFVGVLEDINYGGKQNKNSMTISGRDYTLVLQDITIPPEVYTNEEVSDIIDDFITKYVPDITYNKTVLGNVFKRISFNHISIFDALKRLADECGAYFYIDVYKVLQFVRKGSSVADTTFDNTNVTDARWRKTRKDIVNQVYVYGDKVLTNWSQTFTANGAGSVFDLTYKPHNTKVTSSGILLGGGIENVNIEPSSGVQYLVNFQDKQIVLTSGTEAGYNIPGSLDSVIVDYDRNTPIVKFMRDRESIKKYKLKEHIIVDRNIKDPIEAVKKAKSKLSLNKDLKLTGIIFLKSTLNLNVGDLVTVNLPFDAINNQQYQMIEVTYDFTKQKMLADEVLSVKVNKRIKTLTDTLKNMMQDIKQLQAGDISDTDVLTRLEFGAGSIGIKRNWYVRSKDIGSSFTLDSQITALDDSGLFLDIENSQVIIASGGVF